MKRYAVFFGVLCGCWNAATTLAAGTATFSLNSSMAGGRVRPGATIDWSISVSVSSGDNFGLALVSVDLAQDPLNPASIAMTPGARATGMADFDRPRGYANPTPDGTGSAFGGTPIGGGGALDLIQIGGAQNTFGVVGTGVGEDALVNTGVGHSGQVVATGSFPAPSAPGLYTLSLQSALANTLIGLNIPPQFSPVSAASIAMNPGTMGFTVCGAGDANADGTVDASTDVQAFVNLLLSGDVPGDAVLCAVDLNNDSIVNGADIQPFVGALIN